MVETGTLRHDQTEFVSVALFLVDEPTLGDRAASRLTERALKRSLATAVMRIDTEQHAAGQLAAAAGLSLFAEPNVVAVSNLQKMSDVFLTDVLAYVSALDSNVVLTSRRDDGTRGKRPPDAVRIGNFQCCEALAVKYLNEKTVLVRDEASRARRRMTADAIEALVDTHDGDVGELVAVTSQLLSGVDGMIDEIIMRTHYAGCIQISGFDTADVTAVDNSGKAVAFARHMLVGGVAPIPIVAALVYELRTLALAAVRRNALARPDDPTTSLGQRRGAERVAGQQSNETLITAIQVAVQVDVEAKGALRDPEFALERVILRVAVAKKG